MRERSPRIVGHLGIASSDDSQQSCFAGGLFVWRLESLEEKADGKRV